MTVHTITPVLFAAHAHSKPRKPTAITSDHLPPCPSKWDDALRRQMPHCETERGINQRQPQIIAKDHEVRSAPQHFFERPVDMARPIETSTIVRLARRSSRGKIVSSEISGGAIKQKAPSHPGSPKGATGRNRSISVVGQQADRRSRHQTSQ